MHVYNKNVFFWIFGRGVQLLWKWNVVRRTFLLTSMLDSHTPWENERRESLIAVQVIRTHLLPLPSAIQREERAREGESVAVGWGEEGESDPKKTREKVTTRPTTVKT
jgi:hypothetical protein